MCFEIKPVARSGQLGMLQNRFHYISLISVVVKKIYFLVIYIKKSGVGNTLTAANLFTPLQSHCTGRTFSSAALKLIRLEIFQADVCRAWRPVRAP